MKEVVIVEAARTPIGRFGGALAPFSAVELGVFALEGLWKKITERAPTFSKTAVEECLIGNVLSAGVGQNVARQVAIGAGFPVTLPALSVNKVCGSSLRALTLAAQLIKAGDAEVVIAGGTESMSKAPYLLPQHRQGARFGATSALDSIMIDGLLDAFEGYSMGVTAEKIAKQWKITREEQDAFAYESQRKTAAAQESGRFTEEIIPIPIPRNKGASSIFKRDEHPRPETTKTSLAQLKPAFKAEGTVTAGNASGINDGAAMLLVMSLEKARTFFPPPFFKVVSYATVGLDPSIMGYGPYLAIKKALEKTTLSLEEISLFELNEAFAAQSLAVVKDLGIATDRLNVNGGAIALGHPIGASGGRIVTTLLAELLKRVEAKFGVASLCIGGGQGCALVVEKIK